MIKKVGLMLWLFVLMISAVSAIDVSDYNLTFNLVDDKAVVEIDVSLKENSTEMVEFSLPTDYKGLSVYVGGEAVTSLVEENVLKVDLNGSSQVSFNYVTKEFVDNSNFLMDMTLAFDVEAFEIKLVLPEGATLEKPIGDEGMGSGSIYPKPTGTGTDGKSLIFYWQSTDVKKGSELAIFTQIQPKRSSLWVVIPAVLAFVLAAILVIIFAKKKPESKATMVEKVVEKVAEKKVEQEYDIRKHLKPEEEQIVAILTLKEGSCEQGTIRVATGFSKATLSRILSELEERNVIYKEKRGKKNTVFLKN